MRKLIYNHSHACLGFESWNISRNLPVMDDKSLRRCHGSVWNFQVVIWIPDVWSIRMGRGHAVDGSIQDHTIFFQESFVGKIGLKFQPPHPLSGILFCEFLPSLKLTFWLHLEIGLNSNFLVLWKILMLVSGREGRCLFHYLYPSKSV